jgi:hypothetical protein
VESVTPEFLQKLAEVVLAKSAPSGDRIKAAADFAVAVETLEKRNPDPKNPILPTLRSLIEQLQPAYRGEDTLLVKKAIANDLAELHRISHAIYKTDDHARSKATNEFRRLNPAANMAAEAIVIYPTNRSGAPGLGR